MLHSFVNLRERQHEEKSSWNLPTTFLLTLLARASATQWNRHLFQGTQTVQSVPLSIKAWACLALVLMRVEGRTGAE